jgi:hypothetical protein
MQDKTHVFAVGISSYDIDGRLPKAAEHAVQFCEWSRAAGVPPDHVHVFLSSADHNTFRQRLEQIGISPQAATFAQLMQFIGGKLLRLSGSLLYLFWAATVVPLTMSGAFSSPKT